MELSNLVGHTLNIPTTYKVVKRKLHPFLEPVECLKVYAHGAMKGNEFLYDIKSKRMTVRKSEKKHFSLEWAA